VTRIIAGNLGSLRLKAAAKATRPTSDRVKESVFSKLEYLEALQGARVLDLFAGTGALGFEALSRGAAALTAVEKNSQASAILKENALLIEKALTNQGEACKIQIVSQSAEKFLSTATGKEFDLVFLDPPYEYSNTELEKLLDVLKGQLAKGSLIVLERSSKSKLLTIGPLSVEDEKTYGDTKVWFLKTN
jgi:16S rRNA (guanine966-N2)-methyltransferase